MIGSTRRVTVWAYGSPVDMRKSFNTLHALVAQGLGKDVLAGEVFLFVSRDRRRAKVLLWDGTGLCLYAKRLERHRFTAPWLRPEGTALQMTVSELALFLEGSDLFRAVPLSPKAFELRPAQ